jgi:hypothetical protein
MTMNLTNMECTCNEGDEYYYKWTYDCVEVGVEVLPGVFVNVTTECTPTSGACTVIPNCTAGTLWHPHEAVCAYREPCMKDRETYDEE